MLVAQGIGVESHEENNIYFSQRTFNSIPAIKGSRLDLILKNILMNEGKSVFASDLGSEMLAEQLKNFGFLCEQDSFREKSSCSSSALHEKISIRMNPSIHFLLTQYCNLKCSYCYNGYESYQLNNKLRMSLSSAEQALRIFCRFALKLGHISINFLGGEPLLNWSVASHILKIHKDIARDEGFHGTFGFSVQTNLTFLPHNFINDAKLYNLKVIVEIDGPEDIHNSTRPHGSKNTNSFILTKNNCSILNDNFVEFDCKSVITSKNIGIIDDLEPLHFSLGAKNSSFGFVRPVDSDFGKFDRDLLPKSQDIFNQLTRSKKINGSFWRKAFQDFNASIADQKVCGTAGCHATHASIFTITSDGLIYGCPWFVSNSSYYFGQVSDISLNPELALKSARTLEEVRCKECLSCSFYFACGGPCPVTSALCADDEEIINEIRLSKCALTKTVGRDMLHSRKKIKIHA